MSSPTPTMHSSDAQNIVDIQNPDQNNTVSDKTESKVNSDEDPAEDIDDEYYSDIVVFKVENTRFHVSKKAFLYPGSFFQTLFALPIGDPDITNYTADPLEGSSINNPIKLDGISKDDFRSFLTILCPLEVLPSCSTYSEWRGVLNLSTMWEFPTIREKAIAALSPILIDQCTVADRILISRQFEVKSWLIDAFVKAALVPIFHKELKAAGIDLETIIGLFAVRDAALVRQRDNEDYRVKVFEMGSGKNKYLQVESLGWHRIRTLTAWQTYYNPLQLANDVVEAVVLEEFAEELENMRDD